MQSLLAAYCKHLQEYRPLILSRDLLDIKICGELLRKIKFS